AESAIFGRGAQRPSGTEAEDLRRRAGESAALGSLFELTGLRQVKDDLVTLKSTVAFEKERGDALATKQCSAIFTGNPGTGKTTVARLYGELLAELGALPCGGFEETSGAKLLADGVAGLRKLLDNLVDDGKPALAVGERVEHRPKPGGAAAGAAAKKTGATGAAAKKAGVAVAAAKKTAGPASGTVSAAHADGSYDVEFDGSPPKELCGVARAELRSLAKGGALFIDEAYQLEPKSNPMGRQVLDLLLTNMEDHRGRFVVVLAGYKKPMDELLEHNEGLPSRFRKRFEFADLSDDELAETLTAQLAAARCGADAKHVRIAARRLGRLRGTTGFGNARAVRNLVETARERQAARVVAERERGCGRGAGDHGLLAREDLLGPRIVDVDSAALRELEGLEGLQKVKASVKQLLGMMETNLEREEAEQRPAEVSLNRVFLGNPGTGKTTVARLYGQILRDVGLLSKGDVLVKFPSDFIGGALGQSEANTKAILEASRGCVLVIDEAYGLDPTGGGGGVKCPYKEAALTTIVEQVQGVAGEDRCVLLLGYREDMEAMLRRANPGLARRFQLDAAFVFEDYDDAALLRILLGKVAKIERTLAFEDARAVVRDLAKQRMRPRFGNAGAVDNAISEAVARSEQRLAALPPQERAADSALLLCDFVDGEVDAGAQKDPVAVFDGLVGMDDLHDFAQKCVRTVAAARARGRDPLDDVELTFKFVGNPGTGKTTVARRMGAFFEALDLLGGGVFVETSASDFNTGFVGQAAQRTRAKFDEARGGVLFVDEAYRLHDSANPFMKDAVDEMVNLLTEPAFKGKMVLVLAGYEAQVDAMMDNVNPGLKSRVTQTIRFPDLDASTVAALLCTHLEAKGFVVAGIRGAALEVQARRLCEAPQFANGRDVELWAKRVAGECTASDTVQNAHVANALASLLADRRPPAAPAARAPRGAAARSSAAAPPPPPAAVVVEKAVVVEERVELFADEEAELCAAMRDGGDAIVAALQEACVALGYDKTHETRMALAAVLEEFARGGALAVNIVAFVHEQTSAKGAEIENALRPQAPIVLASMRQKIKYEEDRLAELDRLDEVAKQAAIAREMAVQKRLMGICPAGYSWYREGSGWRCGGGSHYVSANDPSLFVD
ncbi:P-loop containing nucleoside triphosphate hydrolase protein, partial [Pelagophyceae sp. CCMP2097]